MFFPDSTALLHLNNSYLNFSSMLSFFSVLYVCNASVFILYMSCLFFVWENRVFTSHFQIVASFKVRLENLDVINVLVLDEWYLYYVLSGYRL